ncbi:SPOR domain-containing protein, partial [Nonomuraea sp. K274]|nr:SPOR domain-containing protein [Nonomuraea cypriaca]
APQAAAPVPQAAPVAPVANQAEAAAAMAALNMTVPPPAPAVQ